MSEFYFPASQTAKWPACIINSPLSGNFPFPGPPFETPLVGACERDTFINFIMRRVIKLGDE